jgi:nucleotide-binding universal stress UspA family protein
MIRSIVVGTDGSETAQKAVAEAGEIAQGLGAAVSIVTAFERSSGGDDARDAPDDVQHRLSGRDDADAILKEAKAAIEEQGVKDVEVHAAEGDAAEVIVEVAGQRDADLIVVGNKGMTGAKRHFMGSVPNSVSHHAPCSVLIVRTT